MAAIVCIRPWIRNPWNICWSSGYDLSLASLLVPRDLKLKKLINSRRWHDDAGAAEADDDAFHALVEENVKATVMNLRNQGVLSNAYSRRNKTNKLRVFVHGLVVNEETGVVMDLNVSFGPPEQTIPKLPFEVIVKQKRRNSFGKFKPKATKLGPTATSTAVIETTPSSLPTRS